jgi:hypothetical protein
MSAFMVSEQTMNRILSFLYQQAAGHGMRGSLIGVLSAAGHPLAEAASYPEPKLDEAVSKLAGELWAMNARAVRARYVDADKAGMITEPYITRIGGRVTAIQAYKSLGCLHYQCSEGTVPEEPLYKALELMQDRLAHQIVAALPEYEAAEWD